MTEIVMIECKGCGIAYATVNEAGQHNCPGCGYTEEVFDFEDLLPVRLGRLEDIASADDARARFEEWLREYSIARGGNYQTGDVMVVRSLDGWYAILTAAPRLVE